MKQVSDAIWEIEKEGGMNVPGIAFGTDALIKKMQDGRTFGQLKNVSKLPGILKAAMVMPDGHEGYGFPIGGVAAFGMEDGVISPGGVGYDINCTDGETNVLLGHGAYLKMKEIEEHCGENEARFMDLEKFSVKDAKVLYAMKRDEKFSIYQIKTKTGRHLNVTGDHPVYTKDGGMKKASELTTNDMVSICAFGGIHYNEPVDEVIISEKEIEDALKAKRETLSENSKSQIFDDLKKKGALPIKYSSPQLPYLAKIIGYVFGDGSISFIKKRKGVVWFYGKEKDLETIAEDIKKAGFIPSRIYQRVRKHKISTHYRKYDFVHIENSFKVSSTAFASLLVALGTPAGLKTMQDYEVPKWLFKAPLWIKRLFLAALFGAEMSNPSTLNKYNFYAPTLGMNKSESLEASAIRFLTQIKQLLGDFEIETSHIAKVEGYTIQGKHGKTCGYRLQILGRSENTIRFFETVSFEYNAEKFKNACLAANYTRVKEKIKKIREKVRERAMALYANGKTAGEVVGMLSDDFTPKQFITHSIWTKHKNSPRIAFNFLSFAEYKDRYAIGESGLAWDEIEEIDEMPFDDAVYDITINDENHNFIANGIVVSNCGVRLIATDLTEADLTPKKRDLVERLFRNVPSGVGSKGRLRVTDNDLEEALIRGVDWAIEKGYGTRQDKERCEEGGRIDGADPKVVSPTARKRGAPQFGTVGAGNHFVEIQRIDEIADEKIAKAFGLEKGKIAVMLHCGSRGFGHQVCSDSLHEMIAAAGKYKINLPDRELCCAPINSPEADKYIKGMRCAVNYAFNNRHIMMHWVRETFDEVFGKGTSERMPLVYDVCHNIAKFEKHTVDGKERTVCVHRKGATRAFGPGREEIPSIYRGVGQPVLIPGSMGTASYVLAGTQKAMELTWGSTCHGAGRNMSRAQAIRDFGDKNVAENLLSSRNILVKAGDKGLIAEEAPGAYKDVDEVVRSVELAGISKIVAKMIPLAVVKG